MYPEKIYHNMGIHKYIYLTPRVDLYEDAT